MNQPASLAAVLSWFAGGVFLGVIEIIALPRDPTYSTVLQLVPLALLTGGILFVISQYQRLWTEHSPLSSRLREVMSVGWLAVFGVNAGVASINNMSTEIFHFQLPYYYQGVSLAQKIIALCGIFMLGTASILVWRRFRAPLGASVALQLSDFWEKPLTNIGFIALLLGVVLGLAQYWSTVVFAGFILLLAGAMLYPVGRLTEKNIETSGEDPDPR